MLDDWAWWHRNGEVPKHGKPLVLRRGDQALHSLYIDDNVRASDPYVVDVRDLQGIELPSEQVYGIHVVASSPIEAIADPRYFIRLVQKAQQSWRAAAE